MSFTQTDILNAMVFATQRSRLQMLEHMNGKNPHLLSHVTYNIRQAHHIQDYYFPVSLQNRAIMSEINITPTLCEKLSCNFAGPRGNCKSGDVAYNYRVGDVSNFRVACEPACFNLLPNPTFNDDNEEYPHMTRLTYNERLDECVFVPTSTIWAEVPLYRSNEIYETRVNDLPVGFNETFDPMTNSGVAYTYNETYCKSFFDSWDPHKKICVTPVFQQILNVVIGENIVKLTKAGVTALKNNGNTIPPPPNLPTVPDIAQKFTLRNWLSDIDESFVVPDPDADNDNIITNTKLPLVSQKNTERVRLLAEKYGGDNNLGEAVLDGVGAALLALLEGLFTDPMFLAALGIDVISDLLLDGIKKIAKQTIARAGPALAKMMTNFAGTRIYSRVFSVALRSTLTRMLTQVALKLTSQFIIALARMVVLASSVIGILLIIISLFDLLLTFWDPLGFNNKYPPTFLNDLMLYSDSALREQFGTSSPRITFDLLVVIMLTEDELMTINLDAFLWIFEYLNALDVNSEGRRINKGNLMDVPDNIVSDYDEAVARMYIKTPQEFRDFEEKHTIRWRVSKYASQLGWGLVAVATVFLFVQFHLVALIFYVLACLMFVLALINFDVDVVVDNMPPTMLDFVSRSF